MPSFSDFSFFDFTKTGVEASPTPVSPPLITATPGIPWRNSDDPRNMPGANQNTDGLTGNTVDNKFKVQLKGSAGIVAFDVSPDIVESGTANYKSLEPVHLPGSFLVYGNSSARTFQITAKLISRNSAEATTNIKKLWLLRSWRMNHFGATQETLGAPPDIIKLYAYSNSLTTTRTVPTNIHNVPVIISQLTIPYPSDVDYINTEDGEPFPSFMTIDIALTESRAPQEFSTFSLEKFRLGLLDTF